MNKYQRWPCNRLIKTIISFWSVFFILLMHNSLKYWRAYKTNSSHFSVLDYEKKTLRSNLKPDLLVPLPCLSQQAPLFANKCVLKYIENSLLSCNPIQVRPVNFSLVIDKTCQSKYLIHFKSRQQFTPDSLSGRGFMLRSLAGKFKLFYKRWFGWVEAKVIWDDLRQNIY